MDNKFIKVFADEELKDVMTEALAKEALQTYNEIYELWLAAIEARHWWTLGEYMTAVPQVGDFVVETTHTIRYAKARGIDIASLGTVLEVEMENDHDDAVLLKTLYGGEQVWRNAKFIRRPPMSLIIEALKRRI